MQSYFERRRFVQFKNVLEDMLKQDVIGGLNVNVGDRVIDGTMRRALQDMRRTLAATKL